MYYKISLAIFLSILTNGCASLSNSPGVTGIGEDGDYLAVINKSTYFLNYTISSRNVVVHCNVKNDTCVTLNLWDKDGWRIF